METKTVATIAGAAAAGGVLAFAGLSLASAATGTTTAATPTGSYRDGQMRGGPGGMHGTPVTGEAADQVKAAIAEKYPDATVQVVEEEDEGYEAHITKADGTLVHVTLDSNFAITGEHTGPPAGMRGPGGMHHEKQLTGATARKVKAAAKQKIPNGTIIRVEKDRGGVYEAHVIKKNGKEVVVTVNKKFKVTGVEAMRFAPPQGMQQQGTQQGA